MLLSQYKKKELAALQTISGLRPFTAFAAIQCHFPLLFLLTYKAHAKRIKNKIKAARCPASTSQSCGGVFGPFWFAAPIFGTADQPSLRNAFSGFSQGRAEKLQLSATRVRASFTWYLRPSFFHSEVTETLNCSFTSNCFWRQPHVRFEGESVCERRLLVVVGRAWCCVVLRCVELCCTVRDTC